MLKFKQIDTAWFFFLVFYLSVIGRKGLYLMGTKLSVYVKGFLKSF